MRGTSLLLVAAALVAGAAGTAWAKMRIPPSAPVTRLLENLKRELKKSPDDPHRLYLLGRMHALAYARGPQATSWIKDKGTTAGSEVPEVSPRTGQLKVDGEIDDARLTHLRDGIRALRRAAPLAEAAVAPPNKAPEFWADDRPLLYLGLAWLLDDGSRFAPRLGHPEGLEPKDKLSDAEHAAIDAQIAALGAKEEKARTDAFDALRGSLATAWARLVLQKDTKEDMLRAPVAKLLTRWWQDQALDAYRRAWAIAKPFELASELAGGGVLDVAVESGTAILRLLDLQPETDATKAERQDVQTTLDKLNARGRVISPVLFPVSRPRPLAELLPPGRTSTFDIAGDDVPRTWPWPSDDAAFLVWAPEPDSKVTSGRYLFGARTWWIFWRDGYEPLAMLDDDGNGRLAGAELDGIGVWRDRDGDGVAGRDEVTTAEAFGVTWIGVIATGREDGVPAADEGVGLADGTTRPTYDWTPTSLPSPPESGLNNSRTHAGSSGVRHRGQGEF